MSKVSDYLGDKEWMKEDGRPDDTDFRTAIILLEQLQAENEKLLRWVKVDKVQQLESEVAKLKEENKLLEQDIIELNREIVSQNCTCSDGLDGMAISTNAEAMRFLADKGIITIEKEYGRRVIGKWTENANRQEETSADSS